MALTVFVALTGAGVFVVALVTRKRKILLSSSPAPVLLIIWFFLATSRPNAEKEFDRLFGAPNRRVAAAIQTLKPTFMDGHFISFRMRRADFAARIRPQLFKIRLVSSSNLLLGQPLPDGWPPAIELASSVLHGEVEDNDVNLLYFPNEEMAYASILYAQW